MIHAFLVAGLLGLPLAVQAEDLVLNDLNARGAVQLSADELRQLLPNAKVVSHREESTRRWTNGLDGKFVAGSDARQHRLASASPQRGGTGQGTWHVGENGSYCVTIEWPKRSENWCRYMFKLGDKYYGVKSVADGANPAWEFEISK